MAARPTLRASGVGHGVSIIGAVLRFCYLYRFYLGNMGLVFGGCQSLRLKTFMFEYSATLPKASFFHILFDFVHVTTD